MSARGLFSVSPRFGLSARLDRFRFLDDELKEVATFSLSSPASASEVISDSWSILSPSKSMPNRQLAQQTTIQVALLTHQH